MCLTLYLLLPLCARFNNLRAQVRDGAAPKTEPDKGPAALQLGAQTKASLFHRRSSKASLTTGVVAPMDAAGNRQQQENGAG